MPVRFAGYTRTAESKLRVIKEEMRQRMHHSIAEQGKWLGSVVRGYFNYHAVPTNFRALKAFRDEVIRGWRMVLVAAVRELISTGSG